jgi:RimJ/RimL family protein N-acetyltransferase
MHTVFDTSRLSMRQAEPGDAAFLLELMNEPPYIDNIGDRGVRTIADAVRYIDEKYLASYVRHGFGLYVVGIKEGSFPIGICGLVKRDSLDGPDLGFAFLQRFWSRGFAAEAAGGTLEYASRALLLRRVYGVVSPKNARSVRLLERLGFCRVRTQKLPGAALEADLYEAALTPPDRPAEPTPGPGPAVPGPSPR